MHEHDRRSYRALFSIPDLPQVVVSMQLARIAQSMVGVALAAGGPDETAPAAGL